MTTSEAERRQSAPTPDRAELMAALLPVHTAGTLGRLADAVSSAAEIALKASYALIYVEDQHGKLELQLPASDLRRRSLRRAIDAFGNDLLPARLDPKRAPALANALDTQEPVVSSAADLLSALGAKDGAATAQSSLGIASVAFVPLAWAGERFGALLLMFIDEPDAATLRPFADHIACAIANLNPDQAALVVGEDDAIRLVFDARKLESELQKELSRAARYRHEVSIVVIEATNLRLLQERFGRLLTDQLLQRLGGALAQNARDIDVIGAYKQSGYTMILTQAPPEGARAAAERLLATAESLKLATDGAPGLELHLACGWATSPEDGLTADAIFAVVERRMYDAAERVA